MESRGYSLVVMQGFLIAVVHIVDQGLKGVGASLVVAHGPSWVETCGVFPEQG